MHMVRGMGVYERVKMGKARENVHWGEQLGGNLSSLMAANAGRKSATHGEVYPS